MNANELLESARATAKTFHAEFPSLRPDISWLAEAASIERISDEQREEWETAVHGEVRELQALEDREIEVE